MKRYLIGVYAAILLAGCTGRMDINPSGVIANIDKDIRVYNDISPENFKYKYGIIKNVKKLTGERIEDEKTVAYPYKKFDLIYKNNDGVLDTSYNVIVENKLDLFKNNGIILYKSYHKDNINIIGVIKKENESKK